MKKKAIGMLWGWVDGRHRPAEIQNYYGGWIASAKPALIESGYDRIEVSAHAPERFKHPVWVIDYAFRANGHYRVASPASPWLPRMPNTLHLYPPETVYWEDRSAAEDKLIENAYLKFGGGEAASLDNLIRPPARYARFLDPDGIAGKLMLEIIDIEERQGNQGFWRAQSVLCLLIAWLQESEWVEGEAFRIGTAAPAVTPSNLVGKVDAHLAVHLDQPLRLEDLAKALKVSVSSISHRYRKETGETPRQHHVRLRLERAKTMLMSGQTLSEAAAATGFCDPFHLSRVFKDYEHVSPTVFVRRLRKQDEAER